MIDVTLLATSAVSALAPYLAKGAQQIAGDAGKGAAIGATVGGAGGIRNKRVNQAAQQNHAQQTAQAQQKEIEANFKKAFSVCLEGKGYSIK